MSDSNDNGLTVRIISDWEWTEYDPGPILDEDDLGLLPTHAWHRLTEKLVDGQWVRVTHWHFGLEPPDQLDDHRQDWAWDTPELFQVDDDQPILRLVDGEAWGDGTDETDQADSGESEERS